MSKKWITVSRVEGKASRQAHCDLPPGTYEREMGKEGFFGPACHMYHPNPPTAWTSFEGPLRPRAFDSTKFPGHGHTPWRAHELFHNAHTRIRSWRCEHSMDHLVRNADGDEMLFVHNGAGHLYCDYGHLAIEAGDYVMLPRSTSWRLEVTSPLDLLLIEATNSSYMLPDKGLVGPHAIFDPAMLDAPAIDELFKRQEAGEWRVVVKRRNQLTTITFPFNPLDAVGWHGDLFPVRINVKDIRPLMSHRYHLPPSAHTTFVANRFVICTFVPRPFETDPGAIKVPFFHNNDDYDEVIFYHRGRLLQPRQHPPRDDHAAPLRLHPRPAPEGAVADARADQAGHRRVRGDDRHPRRTHRHRSRRDHRVEGLCGFVEGGEGGVKP
jgi:homogentisate 1,2-dioxygenase